MQNKRRLGGQQLSAKLGSSGGSRKKGRRGGAPSDETSKGNGSRSDEAKSNKSAR